MFDDGTPNSVGLILLFVGLGYCLLWFFEDRTARRRAITSGTTRRRGAVMQRDWKATRNDGRHA